MTREEFNKNSYLVNNNALYNKHTEHISTTEPIFIDGMAGSDNIVHEREGDASQNTYWAYEYESGKFLLGKFNEDDIKVECETDSSNLWIVDAEGVYIEQDALNSYMESECIDAINAKYGTSFTALTMQKVTSVAIGDDCPNWNAYEKIMLPKTLFAYEANPNNLIVGEFEGDTLRIQTSGNNNVVWLSSETGVIIGSMPLSAPTLEKILQEVNEKFGTSFEGWSQLPTVYEVNDTVSDWASYNILTDFEKYAISVEDYYLATKVIAQDNNSPICIANRGDYNNLLKINSEGSVVGIVAMSETLFSTIINAISNETGVNHANTSPQPVLMIQDGSVFPLFEEYEKI